MVVQVTGGTIHMELVITAPTLQKKKPNVKDIMVRVAADLLEVDMFDGITELIQKEKQPNLVTN